ncbi:hypothetical protein [Aestuariivirga sp.]
MPWLNENRLLVAEDEASFAVMAKDMLTGMGSMLVSPVATIGPGG